MPVVCHAQLRSQLLTEKASAAGVEAAWHQAVMEAELQEKLAKDGLTSDLELKRARLRATEQGTRQTLEQERLLSPSRPEMVTARGPPASSSRFPSRWARA